jgi:hypothetical protein
VAGTRRIGPAHAGEPQKVWIMSVEARIEERIRAAIQFGGGQCDFTGAVMDGIIDATGCTQKELEAVLEDRFVPLEVGRFGIPNIWTLPPNPP